jgi:hypothetical protein
MILGTRVYTVQCDRDKPGCVEAWDVEGAENATEARREARERAGWTRVRLRGHGKFIDVCPNCAEVSA